MNMTRVYSLLKVKAIDEDKREITGIATTPKSDSAGDIVEPDGAEYTLPIPLLWQHDALQPIGEVYAAKTTKDGIEIKARLVKVLAPSQLSARLDEAWQSIKTGLVKGLSIGFRPLEYSFMDEGGIRFSKWAWHELSAVTIPANREANIATIKSVDSNFLAALGKKEVGKDAIKTPAGATAKNNQTNKPTPKEGKKPMKISDQIKQFQAERVAKAAQMDEMMETAAAAGETLDKAQEETYDTLAGEVKSIDAHLGRLETLEKSQLAKATIVDNKANSSDAASANRGGHSHVTLKSNLPQGVAFARVAKCLGIAKGNLMQAQEIAAVNYKDDARIANVLKTAVAAGSTTNANWAGNLVGEEGSVYADFVEFLRPQTIIGKFGSGNVPSLRRVPFRVPLLGQTSGGAGYWVGEGKAKPLTSFDFSRTTLEPLKVANIAVLTEEVLRDSSPSADLLVRDGLVDALRERLDIDFINPAKAASAGLSPASITNGVTPITSSGTDAEAVRCDIKALFQAFINANNAPKSGVFIMSASTALALSLMQNPLGQTEFPGISMDGGMLFGLPVIVSEYLPSDTSGGLVILVNASDIYLGDEGGFSVDISREASLQMDNAPTQSSIATVTASTMVSLWQTNSVGFRAERHINWSRRRVSAVAYLEGVLWGACAQTKTFLPRSNFRPGD